MASMKRTISYRCSDDCKPSGCPAHEGVLEYQSCSDAYTFTMNGRVIELERGELDAMLALLKSLDRIDAAK